MALGRGCTCLSAPSVQNDCLQVLKICSHLLNIFLEVFVVCIGVPSVAWISASCGLIEAGCKG